MDDFDSIIEEETFLQFSNVLLERTEKGIIKWKFCFFDPIHFEMLDENGTILQSAVLEGVDENKNIRIAYSESIDIKTGAPYMSIDADLTSEKFSYSYNCSFPPVQGSHQEQGERLNLIIVNLTETIINSAIKENELHGNSFSEKRVYLSSDNRNYRSIPIVRLCSRLHTDKRYIAFHRCVWDLNERQKEYKKYNVKKLNKMA